MVFNTFCTPDIFSLIDSKCASSRSRSDSNGGALGSSRAGSASSEVDPEILASAVGFPTCAFTGVAEEGLPPDRHRNE